MSKLYLFAPQWQDSGLSKKLYRGAMALRAYFASISDEPVSEVDIDKKAKPKLENNIVGHAILRKQLRGIHDAIESGQPEKIACIGGGCGVDVPIVSYLAGRHEDLRIFWFDAHGDLNTPESSPSKHFHGMPLRFIAEKQDVDLGLQVRNVPPPNICLVGARDLDKPEQEFIVASGISRISIGTNYWVDLCHATGARAPAYIHIDLDVLDPIEYRNVKCPVKNGMAIDELLESVRYLKSKMNVVGMSVLENTETGKKRLAKIRELLGEAISL